MSDVRSHPDASPAVRDRVGARQHEVLAALLAGVVPAGFEPCLTLATGLALRRKRWRAAVSIFPLLGRQPHAWEMFDQYARAQRRVGCAHTDVTGFCTWADHQNWPPAAALRRCWQVERGQRRVAWAHIDDELLLIVGIGPWLYELPMRGWGRS